MISALRTGIYTLLKTATGVSASNLFFEKARPRTSKPYVIFKSIANPSTRDSVNYFEKDYIQISIYASTLSSAETIMAAIQAVFDDSESSLSVTGWTVVNVDRISKPAYFNDVERSGAKAKDYWFIALEYMIETEKSRS